MEPETQQSNQAEEAKGQSRVFNVSVRAWLSLIIVGTMCYCWVAGIDLDDFMKYVTTTVIAWYFAQKTKEGQS